MHAALARLNRLVAELTPESDGRLLDAFLAGSEPAFRELVARHGSLVFAVCNRVLRHRQDAEDAFQAVFLVLARRAADVWPRDAVGSWLYGVAHRVALKARALRTKRHTREHPLEDVARPTLPLPEPDLAEIIDRAVRKLPEAYRAAVVACDLEGLSRKDAAEQLGWKEGTLSGRLARARKLLADRLRKTGLALPAGGLAAVLGTESPVRAGLADSVVELVSGNAAVEVPAPIAVLTEGVVQSMFAFHLKTVAAVVVLACGLGYGAWASGAGAGDGPGSAPVNGITPVVAAQPPAKPKAEPPPPLPKSLAALEPFQGKWRVITIAEGETTTAVWKWTDQPWEVEIAGATFAMPYRDGSGGRKREEYKFAVDDTAQPPTIDLIAPGKPVGKGIYQFTGRSMTCTLCHEHPWKENRFEPVRDLVTCKPGFKVATGLRLTIATSGPRPTKFGSGTEGVIEFTLERVADTKDAEREKLIRETARLEAFLKAVGTTDEKKAETMLRLAELRVQEARWAQDVARLDVDMAQAQVEKAIQQFTLASRNLQAAQQKLTEAEKAVAKDGKKPPAAPAKDGDVFTVHVRPLAAAEKLIRVKATGNQTVLEGLAYAAEDMAIKADALSVWVVRDKSILPVDLAGITQKGETKTNYILKPGDQLFVQVKVGK
jgi:RNA polymerase sigma factor (sigma-70 family)